MPSLSQVLAANGLPGVAPRRKAREIGIGRFARFGFPDHTLAPAPVNAPRLLAMERAKGLNR